MSTSIINKCLPVELDEFTKEVIVTRYKQAATLRRRWRPMPLLLNDRSELEGASRCAYCLEQRHKAFSYNDILLAASIHQRILALEEEIDLDDNEEDYLAAAALEEELELLWVRHSRLLYAQNDEDLRAREALTPVRNSTRINDWAEAHIAENFRFRSRDHLRHVLTLLQLREVCTFLNGEIMNRERLLLISLKRLSSELTLLLDLASQIFGGHYSLIGKAFRFFTRHVALHFAHKLDNNLQYWLPRFPEFAEAIRLAVNAHGPANLPPGGCDIVGFIDCTNWFSCRPGGGPAAPGGPGVPRNPPILQQAVYSGHKKQHGVKMQTAEGPNGLCIHAYGPCSARHNDLFLLRHSHINAMLRNLLHALGRQFGFFGDSIYPWISNIRYMYPFFTQMIYTI
jgi:hypothetical protein